MRGFKGVLEQRPTDEHNTNNMKTEKTKGDILAERIEKWIVGTSPLRDLREALADYRKPEWTLGRSVPVLTPAQIADGWIEWHGGDCPVWGGSKPKFMMRDRAEWNDESASNLRWDHRGNDGDIIAYRPDPYEALKKAHSEGKVIEVCDSRIEIWIAEENPCFDSTPDRYRIKPSPIMVPLGPEDVPPGSAIRVIGSDNWRMVLGNYEGVLTYNAKYSYEDLQQHYEISRDGGKTWQKCEKEVK